MPIQIITKLNALMRKQIIDSIHVNCKTYQVWKYPFFSLVIPGIDDTSNKSDNTNEYGHAYTRKHNPCHLLRLDINLIDVL